MNAPMIANILSPITILMELSFVNERSVNIVLLLIAYLFLRRRKIKDKNTDGAAV